MAPSAALAIASATALVSFALTSLAVRILTARAILDRPNERSSHVAPTPRGAGLAVVGALLPALALIAALTGEGARLAPVLAAIPLLAGLCFLDDVKGLGAGVRLLAQAAAVVLGLLSLPEGPVTQGFLPFWLDRLLVAIGWLWFINLFNFMDGIDGITAVETIAIGLGLTLVAWFAAIPGATGPAGLAIAAAAAGFLPWNWHRARIFLGDVGSVPLGFLLGFLLLDLAARGYWAAALILPLYYLADATATLLRRLLRGERVWEAHREHWYQKAAAASGHDTVSLRIGAANLLLVAAAVATATVPWIFVLVAAAVVLGLIGELRRLARRRALVA
jgi:UDP-N-acetylmuramyl pentapeptide phosphotransferase/UDP-N-acetylglucosamine-1-phosphate transferase